MIFLGYLLAILPAAAIAYFAIYQLKEKPILWISLSILFGIAVIYPSFQLERLEVLFDEDGMDKGWPLFTIAFGFVGFGEELFKGLAVLAIAHFSKQIITIKRGIIYSVLVAMGFALLENIFYAYLHPISTIVVRSFTAVPAHGVFAIIVGYFLGMTYSFTPKNWSYFLRGLLFAGLLHGAYDWFILQGYNDNLTGGAILVFALGIYYAYCLLKLAKERSPISPAESPNLSDNSLQGETNSQDDLQAETDDAQP